MFAGFVLLHVLDLTVVFSNLLFYDNLVKLVEILYGLVCDLSVFLSFPWLVRVLQTAVRQLLGITAIFRTDSALLQHLGLSHSSSELFFTWKELLKELWNKLSKVLHFQNSEYFRSLC